jgi:hypothetical protein
MAEVEPFPVPLVKSGGLVVAKSKNDLGDILPLENIA